MLQDCRQPLQIIIEENVDFKKNLKYHQKDHEQINDDINDAAGTVYHDSYGAS